MSILFLSSENFPSLSLSHCTCSTWGRIRNLIVTGLDWSPLKMVPGGLASVGISTISSSMSSI